MIVKCGKKTYKQVSRLTTKGATTIIQQWQHNCKEKSTIVRGAIIVVDNVRNFTKVVNS